MTNFEFKTQLERRTKEFAVTAFKYLDALPKKVSKEASETCYWLEVLSDLYPTHETARKLLSESIELRNLFQSISQTTRTRKLKHS